MSTSTVRFHRVLRAAPEKVYRAFLDPDAMAKWLPPNGFTGKVHRTASRLHVTARIRKLAGPGDILVSSTVKDIVVGSDTRFEDRGQHSLKGMPGEWRLFSLAD